MSGQVIDHTGKVFGRLRVLRHAGKRGKYHYWTCICECGNTKDVQAAALNHGHTKSCGCLAKDANGRRTHGMSQSREHLIWRQMIARCSNPKHNRYTRYGGRGIVVCDRWLGQDGFAAFYKDMGPCPSSDHQIDRLDNDGDYQPDNCRWATRKEQARNRRNNHHLVVDGVSKTIAEWAEDMDVKQHMIICRLRRGWSERRAVLTPVRVQ